MCYVVNSTVSHGLSVPFNAISIIIIICPWFVCWFSLSGYYVNFVFIFWIEFSFNSVLAKRLAEKSTTETDNLVSSGIITCSIMSRWAWTPTECCTPCRWTAPVSITWTSARLHWSVWCHMTCCGRCQALSCWPRRQTVPCCVCRRATRRRRVPTSCRSCICGTKSPRGRPNYEHTMTSSSPTPSVCMSLSRHSQNYSL